MEITADLQISAYLHCGKCVDEWKTDKSINAIMPPRDYARLSVGWTPKGIQVWCNRHGVNVVNIDFEGAKHPAVTYAHELKIKGGENG